IQLCGDVTSSSSGDEIRADVGYPGIHEFYMRETGTGTDQLNSQLDVNDQYYFLLRTNYSIGWSDNVRVDIRAWYDDGSELTLYDDGVADRSKANLQFRMAYTSGSPGSDGTWAMSYPTTGEVKILSFNESRANIGGLGAEEDHRWLQVNFSLGPQIRNASSGGAWTVSSDNSDPAQSFNDPYSWNIDVNMSDIAYPDANSHWYDEFGTYKYLTISVTGDPSGSGAPGANTVSIQPGTNLTYSSNSKYYVNISVTDLWDATATHMIGADNISAWNQNSTNQYNSTINTITHFTGADEPHRLWYNQTDTFLPPTNAGNTTTGDTDLVDSTTWIAWYIDIPPSIPEGTYTGTIKYTIYGL
ncbi:MAG: hypothetical protein KAT70_04895, partial [Thermoplasmata archaeon]|nr:hypothetical protein [Thermoplasmata archaeon]